MSAGIIPIIGAQSEGGVIDISSDGRTVTISLSAKNALPVRELMAARQPAPFVLAATQLAVLAEIDGRGVTIKVANP